MAKIFISYRYHSDGQISDDVRALLGNAELITPHVAVRLDGALPHTHDRDQRIHDAIVDAMRSCHVLVVIVGPDAHNSPWQRNEISIARGFRIPIVAVRGRGYGGGAPPALGGARIIEWSAREVAQAIEVAIGRGR